MVDGVQNPYRSDLSAAELFVGRHELITELTAAVLRGRNAIRAVMGGRGIGKTSLAKRLQRELGEKCLTVVTSGNVQTVAHELGRALGVDLDSGHPVEAIRAAVENQPMGRVAVILDEVERILRDPDGVAFLGNLLKAYEITEGKLALLAMGGTGVRDLLLDEASPFLRVGLIHTLSGLTRAEAATLLRDPLRVDVPDEVVDALWAETGGHPWLLQMFMEIAVERSTTVAEIVGRLPAAMREAESRLHAVAFPLWWDNFRDRGREVYRQLVTRPSAVPRAEWVARFGSDPVPWLEVLRSTGIASLDGEEALARGTMFRGWVEQNHPRTTPAIVRGRDELNAWLSAVGVDAFERLVVRALAAWARATVEFPAAAVRSGPGNGNAALQPEAFFQMHAIVALLQHEDELTAEPEALSMGRARRSDIKARSRHDPARRACIELKIFGRDDEGVVAQVIGYSAPADTFAAVVSVDRAERPLRPAYMARCFADAIPSATHDAPGALAALAPSFCTEHVRTGLSALRVWHFLVSLRDA